ncbi:PH domain-containing protein [Chitinimonas koreensis]|uniref:PH domain-containing protein n=1 Tax=Chitinimonas koreensis TaxID=356302 RepID=UPI0003F7194E|nr:PH domain-containing protein [Chitinimonas koreensis]
MNPTAALHARFNPLIRPYLVLYGGLTLAITVVGLPLALLWFCGVGQWWARHYFDKLECELGPTALRFRKGILFQVEKTIPLENIQDVTFIEGPLLKRFHLSILKFETAGQSAGQAHDMKLIGVIDAADFRGEILQRREALKHSLALQRPAAPAADDESLALQRAMLARLDEIAALLRER